MILQRFKAILMSLRDGSDSASKWLELLPMDEMPTMASMSEDYAARKMAVEQAKSDQLLKKMSSC